VRNVAVSSSSNISGEERERKRKWKRLSIDATGGGIFFLRGRGEEPVASLLCRKKKNGRISGGKLQSFMRKWIPRKRPFSPGGGRKRGIVRGEKRDRLSQTPDWGPSGEVRGHNT